MSIGIIRRNGLGDVICSLPLVYLCQQRAPEAAILFFIDERAAALAPYLEGPSEIIIMKGGYLGMALLAWKERRRSFDQLISAKPSPMKMVNFLMRCLKAKKRIAPILHQKDPFTHQALKTLRLVDPSLQEVAPYLRPRLKMPPLQNFSTTSPVLFISVTNNRIGSTLDLDKYERIISALQKPFYLVINGEPKDRAAAERLSGLLQVPHEIRLTDSFDAFMSLIASSDALLIGDGGIMHIAAAYDKPQVVLFGGTPITEWAPLSDRAKCLGDPHNVNFISEHAIIRSLEEIL